jgi:hypothetical protein
MGATAKKTTTMETPGGLLDSSGKWRSVIHSQPKEIKRQRDRNDAIPGEIEQTKKFIEFSIS